MQSAQVGCKSALHGEVVEVPLSQVHLGRLNIRSHPGDLDALRDSIIRFGLLNPIIIRKLRSSYYEVIAGNRRLKVITNLGLPTIPARVVEADDKECYEISLVENLQTETLSPLDEARAFYKYVSSREKRGLGYGSITELAKRIGKSQEYISNRMGLLRLRESTLRRLLDEKRLSVSHVEELASISEDAAAVDELSDLVINNRIPVRVLEKAVRLIRNGVEISRALDLAKIESEMGLGSEKSGCDTNQLERFLAKSKLILKTTLSYLDNATSELENEPEVYRYWVKNVRLPVHKAIDGTIVCQKRLSRKGKTVGQSTRMIFHVE
jgi:ParB family chromosome partitioning protein